MLIRFCFILPVALYIITKKNGTSTIPMVTATIIPKNTPVPIACRLAEPGPVANTIGSIPRINANDVIRIGRKRNCAACMADSITSLPCLPRLWQIPR